MQQAVLRVSAILLLVVAVAATAAYLLEGDDGPGTGNGPAKGRPFADALLQLSHIYISEPTRPRLISYAVLCL